MDREVVSESLAGWKGRGTRIYLYKSNFDQINFNLQHLALTARNRDEIDKFSYWAETEGISIISGPKAYPEYGEDYYAIFFSGPDDIKLELVHLTEENGDQTL